MTQHTETAPRGAGEDGRKPPGADADTPTEIPAKGWWQITKRAFKEGGQDNIGLLAAGVAFFAFTAIFPAAIAAFTIYGLVADPTKVADQVQEFASGLPAETQTILVTQLGQIAAQSNGALGFGLIVSLLAALWSTSGAMSNLMLAVNIAYDEEETRGFVKKRAIALLLTLGAIVFFLLAIGLIAVVPNLIDDFGTAGRLGAQVIRWGLLLGLVAVTLAVVFKVAPDRDAPKMRWASVGAIVATVLWLIGTVLFSLYVSNFGSYNKTYGAIAGVVIVLLWLYLTCYIILLGAEINAESEQQTEKDSTVGPPKPKGERDAVAADSGSRGDPV